MVMVMIRFAVRHGLPSSLSPVCLVVVVAVPPDSIIKNKPSS